VKYLMNEHEGIKGIGKSILFIYEAVKVST
jgi:hypothetical protein